MSEFCCFRSSKFPTFANRITKLKGNLGLRKKNKKSKLPGVLFANKDYKWYASLRAKCTSGKHISSCAESKIPLSRMSIMSLRWNLGLLQVS